MLKNALKSLIKKLPFAVTRNQRYDLLTRTILKRYCQPDTCCVDVGAHKGEILELYFQYAPRGQHWAFEPIPDYAEALKRRFAARAQVHQLALSDRAGSSEFNFVTSNPSYSGLRRRKYDRHGEKDQKITVRTARLDDVVPIDQRVDFIKIDVEGAELLVLKGGAATIRRNRPLIVFEHGQGAADVYDYGPEELFGFVSALEMRISLLDAWLKKESSLSAHQFVEEYQSGRNYYFIAHPENQ